MMILTAKSVFLVILFTFLGTHARNLPEDILKIGNTDYKLASRIASIRRPPRKSPPSPQLNPPTHPIMSLSRMAPPRDQANAYYRWTSIFATSRKALEPSHLSQQVPSTRVKQRSFSCVTQKPDDDEIMRPHLPSPPPPHLAPPHTEMGIYATE